MLGWAAHAPRVIGVETGIARVENEAVQLVANQLYSHGSQADTEILVFLSRQLNKKKRHTKQQM